MSTHSLYYEDLLVAFIRGRRPDAPQLPVDELALWAIGCGLRIHKFKRGEAPLPRVRRVLGILRALWPETLLDVGSGRGTFLLPMLDAFPELPVTSAEIHPVRLRDLEALSRGGVSRLSVRAADIQSAPLPRHGWDVITALEVLEHLQDPAHAAENMLGAARRAVVVTVPSVPDNNPEHLRLYTGETLTRLFCDAGAREVRVEYIQGHIVGLVTPP